MATELSIDSELIEGWALSRELILERCQPLRRMVTAGVGLAPAAFL